MNTRKKSVNAPPLPTHEDATATQQEQASDQLVEAAQPALTPEDYAPLPEPSAAPEPILDADLETAQAAMPETTNQQESAAPEFAAEHERLQAQPDREHQRQQTQDIMERIRREAEELDPEHRQHLDAHLLANQMHNLNKETFAQVNTFKQLSLTFYNLRANSKAFLSLRPDQLAIWSEGGGGSRMVGLSFATSTEPALYLRNVLINAREMYLETYQDCTEIVLDLYVRTEQDQIKGRVDLPPGASVTLQSRCDRSSIIGLSSFAVDLE